MKTLITLITLLALSAPAAFADPTDWTPTTGCQEDLDLTSVGRSYNYRFFVEGPLPNGTTSGIAMTPEWLPLLTKLDRAIGGGWMVVQNPLVDYYGPGQHYWNTTLISQTMLEVGTGDVDPFEFDCAVSAAFGNKAFWTSDGVAQGTELTFTHVAFTVQAAVGNADVYAILLNTSGGSLELVHGIRLNGLPGKTSAQPVWEDVAISIEMLINPGLGENAIRTVIVGEDTSAFDVSLDDLWVETAALNEEPPPAVEETALQRADINKDGAVGANDFAAISFYWGTTGIEH